MRVHTHTHTHTRTHTHTHTQGYKEQALEGTLTAHPVSGCKFVIEDGASHAVDSSELAFKIAAKGAFKQACDAAGPVVLEPLMSVQVCRVCVCVSVCECVCVCVLMYVFDVCVYSFLICVFPCTCVRMCVFLCVAFCVRQRLTT